MRVHLAGVARHYGAQTVLDQVTFALGPRSRVGVVGPNGVGKSTLLKILAGAELPDEGVVVRVPATLTSGYLSQDRRTTRSTTLLEMLAEQTDVAAAERTLHEAAEVLAARRGRGCRGYVFGSPRAVSRTGRWRLRGPCPHDVRGARVDGRRSDCCRRPLGRRGGARCARRDPAVAVRRAAPR